MLLANVSKELIIDRLKLSRDSGLDSLNKYTFNSVLPYIFLPEGVYEIILQLGNTFYQGNNKTDLRKRPDMFIGGLHTSSYIVQAVCPGSKVIGIKIDPSVIMNLIGGNMKYYKNNLIPLSKVFSKTDLEPLERLNASSTDLEISRTIESVFQVLLKNQKDSCIGEVAKHLIKVKGVYQLSGLAPLYGMSESNLRKKFTEEIGCSPKLFCSLIRTKYAFGKIKEGGYGKFSDLAYELGYFDQSHFIKSFKAVTQLTPSEYEQYLIRC